MTNLLTLKKPVRIKDGNAEYESDQVEAHPCPLVPTATTGRGAEDPNQPIPRKVRAVHVDGARVKLRKRRTVGIAPADVIGVETLD